MYIARYVVTSIGKGKGDLNEKYDFEQTASSRTIRCKKCGRKVAGWSDIDCLALKEDEVVVAQCKSFIGTGKSEIIAEKLIDWFNYAVDFLRSNHKYRGWLGSRRIERVLIVDFSVNKTIQVLQAKGIKIFQCREILEELLRIIKKEMKPHRYGKEDDALLRILISMIEWKTINPTIFEKSEHT